MRTLRLAMAQINATVGDLDGNTSKVIDYIEQARSFSADLVAFPELVITGYPPEDLLLRPQFIKDNVAKMQEVVAAVARYRGRHRLRGHGIGHPQRGGGGARRQAGRRLPQDSPA